TVTDLPTTHLRRRERTPRPESAADLEALAALQALDVGIAAIDDAMRDPHGWAELLESEKAWGRLMSDNTRTAIVKALHGAVTNLRQAIALRPWQRSSAVWEALHFAGVKVPRAALIDFVTKTDPNATMTADTLADKIVDHFSLEEGT